MHAVVGQLNKIYRYYDKYIVQTSLFFLISIGLGAFHTAVDCIPRIYHLPTLLWLYMLWKNKEFMENFDGNNLSNYACHHTDCF